jgi:hypothetical protein
VTHALEFLHDRLNPARPNEQNTIRQPAGQILCQLFPRQQLLGQNGIFGVHQADMPVQLYGDSCH